MCFCKPELVCKQENSRLTEKSYRVQGAVVSLQICEKAEPQRLGRISARLYGGG